MSQSASWLVWVWRGRRRSAPLAVLSALALVAGCGDGEESIEVDVSTTSSPATAIDDTRAPEIDDAAPVDERPAPDPSKLPEATAPSGLGSPELPDDADRVEALFAALPEELLGAARDVVRVGPGMVAARYDAGDRQCTEVGLQAIDITSAEGAFYPEDWRAEHVVALFASGADWDVEEAGHDGTRYWVTFETYCGGEDMETDEIISSATWGDEGSPWVFVVGASNPTDRDILLTEFVDAAATVRPGT